MRRAFYRSIISCAIFGVLFAGAMIDRSLGPAIAEPGGGCSANCAVGSDQGGLLKREESRVDPGSSIQAAGTQGAGLLRFTAKEQGATEGSLIGREVDVDEMTGKGTNVGRVTGDFVVQDDDPNTPVVISCSGRCEFLVEP
jgi:hypothetical protein